MYVYAVGIRTHIFTHTNLCTYTHTHITAAQKGGEVRHIHVYMYVNVYRCIQ